MSDRDPRPIWLGKFEPMKAADVLDRYIDIAADLDTGETIATATFTLEALDADNDEDLDDAIPGAGVSLSAARVDFQITVPTTPGDYQLTVVFGISDSQKITKTAGVVVA